MTIPATLKNNFTALACCLFALLFTYAALGKILDFENFQVQLGQSPLLTAFAGHVSYAVPILELLLSVLLFAGSTRTAALFFSYSLMCMFTAYIYILLNWSAFIPCSCGGILERLGWTEHLVFNVAFILLGITAIFCLPSGGSPKSRTMGAKKKSVLLISSGLASFAAVAVLFMLSENIVAAHNTFTRRFAHFSAVEDSKLDIGYDSYYLAGASESTIYLGNVTAPLHILEIDTALRKAVQRRIILDSTALPFRALSVSAAPPYFFVTDGNVPCIFRGKVSDWKASHISRGDSYFSHAIAIDSATLAVRSVLARTRATSLGIISVQKEAKAAFRPSLIDWQGDGIFASDGTLSLDVSNGELAYASRHTNRYFVTDASLALRTRGNTIDTVATARIRLAKVESRSELKLSAPPLSVNRLSASYGGLLFINSELPGKYEPLEMWKKASIIDAYSKRGGAYIGSFYIHHVGGKKISGFIVRGGSLYAIAGSHIVRYRLGGAITKNYASGSGEGRKPATE